MVLGQSFVFDLKSTRREPLDIWNHIRSLLFAPSVHIMPTKPQRESDAAAGILAIS